MSKTKSWKWAFVAIILIISVYQIQKSIHFTYPEHFELENFPIYKQPDSISCGPTSLKMLMEYYGYEYELKEIRKYTKTDWYAEGDIEIGGTTPEYMSQALEHYGIHSSIVSSNIDGLKYYVSEKRPPVALVRSGKRYWHWVVVIGYTDNTIITADPDGSRKELTTEQFENAWNFSSDLLGRDVSSKCKICDGDGRIYDLGPFGLCDVCGGTGLSPDWYAILLALGEARSYIIIVPNKSKE